MQPQMPIGSSLKNKGDTYEQKKDNSGYLYDGLFNYHRICLSLHLEIPKRNKKSETENTQHDNNENTETEQAENNESISFQDFEALEDFFSKEQVKLFQEELTSYLKNVKQMSLTSIRFLADDTTYPNASDINFLFQLPDKSVLPVYYTSSTGRFFFGEERTPDSGKEIIYERPTDDKLPSITTEEIEQLQEGGYDDTSVNSEKAAPVTEVPETPSMEEPKEVQP